MIKSKAIRQEIISQAEKHIRWGKEALSNAPDFRDGFVRGIEHITEILTGGVTPSGEPVENETNSEPRVAC